jgi:hypothetical protein
MHEKVLQRMFVSEGSMAGKPEAKTEVIERLELLMQSLVEKPLGARTRTSLRWTQFLFDNFLKVVQFAGTSVRHVISQEPRVYRGTSHTQMFS